MKDSLVLFTSSLIFVGIAWGCDMASSRPQATGGKGKRPLVMLIGASVGKAWQLTDLPERTGDDAFSFQSIAVYEYDKGEALEEVLLFPKRKFRLSRSYVKALFEAPPAAPDIIILKECAAYFPGDLDRYRTLMQAWTERVVGKKRRVILATVVPVTKERAATKKGQAEAIWAFNDWIRAYGRQKGVPVLDLEAAVQEGDGSRFLRADVSTDGLHLNGKGYGLLDECLLGLLKSSEVEHLTEGVRDRQREG